MLRLVIYTCLVLLALGKDNDVISVPEDVLKFIIGCKQVQPGTQLSQLAVPVHHTSIDDSRGTTSQQVSILSLSELRSSLKQSVHSDAVLDHIIGQVEEAARTDDFSLGRSDCVVENNINISVPAGEIDSFNDRVQMLMQQNSFKMLEQINTLFAYKLRIQKIETDRLIKRRTNSILAKLDKIMKHLGIADEDTGDENESTDEGELLTSLPPEIVTWASLELEPTTEAGTQPASESPSEPETSPAPEPVPEPTNSPTEAERVTELPEIDGSPTELFPSTSSTSSEEDDDDRSDPADRTASGSAGATDNEHSDFVRVSQQSPEYIASQNSEQKDTAPKTPAQIPTKNISFNSGIGLIPMRTRPIPARLPFGSNHQGLSLEERMRQADPRRRIVNRYRA